MKRPFLVLLVCFGSMLSNNSCKKVKINPIEEEPSTERSPDSDADTLSDSLDELDRDTYVEMVTDRDKNASTDVTQASKATPTRIQ